MKIYTSLSTLFFNKNLKFTLLNKRKHSKLTFCGNFYFILFLVIFDWMVHKIMKYIIFIILIYNGEIKVTFLTN